MCSVINTYNVERIEFFLKLSRYLLWWILLSTHEKYINDTQIKRWVEGTDREFRVIIFHIKIKIPLLLSADFIRVVRSYVSCYWLGKSTRRIESYSHSAIFNRLAFASLPAQLSSSVPSNRSSDFGSYLNFISLQWQNHKGNDSCRVPIFSRVEFISVAWLISDCGDSSTATYKYMLFSTYIHESWPWLIDLLILMRIVRCLFGARDNVTKLLLQLHICK